MKQQLNWGRVAQWVVVLACAFSLKLYYSRAGADQLRWILGPTAGLVELVSGTSFEFEPRAGYLSDDRRFLIAPVCAGVNFLIAAFLMLSIRKLLREPSQGRVWAFLPAALGIAYLVTLVANAARIAIALRLGRLPQVDGLDGRALHRAEGILVYFAFLLLLFVASERWGAGKVAGLWRQAYFPLLIYYATTLGIPLANGGYRQGAGFWEHAAFVLLIPFLLILPLVVFRRLRRGEAGSNPEASV